MRKLVKDGHLIYPDNKDHFPAPMFVVHDVLQNSGYGESQRLMFSKSMSLFEGFRKAMKLLKGQNVRLLVVASGIDDRRKEYKDWIKYIESHPEWDIQCHGLRHEWYTRKDDKDITKDLIEAKEKIKNTFGKEPIYFYPPRRKCNDKVIKAAKKAGLEVKYAGSDYNRIGKCIREPYYYSSVDFHYWFGKDVKKVKKLLGYHRVAEPIIVIGAPRSGTTALMRYLNYNIKDSVALKEKEKIWSSGIGLRDYYSDIAGKNDAKVIIDKNVRNSFRIRKIMKSFPYATFIHIIRDGRASANSWRNWAVKTDKEDQTIEHAAQQWVDYVSYIIRYRNRLSKKGSYIEVRYEDLCDNVDYFESRNSKWKKQLTKKEIEAVEEIQQPLLRRLGYTGD